MPPPPTLCAWVLLVVLFLTCLVAAVVGAAVWVLGGGPTSSARAEEEEEEEEDGDCSLDTKVLECLKWHEFQLEEHGGGNRPIVFVAADPGAASLPGGLEAEPLLLGGVGDWLPRAYEHLTSRNKNAEEHVVVVIFSGRRLDPRWALGAQLALPQGTSYFGCTWYFSSNIKRYFTCPEAKGTVWPLSLPASATVPTSVSRTGQRDQSGWIIHQTWKSWGQLSHTDLMSVRRIQSQNVGSSHWFWPDEACEELVRTYFDPRVWRLYRSLLAGAYRADVWRLCALYAFGGVYVDIDLGLFEPFSEFLDPSLPIQLCRDLPHRFDLELTDRRTGHKVSEYLYNALLAARSPGEPFFRRALLRALAHVRALSHDSSLAAACARDPLFPTGPGCLGLAWYDHTGGHQEEAVVLRVTFGREPDGGGFQIVASRGGGQVVVGTTKNALFIGQYVQMFLDGKWCTGADWVGPVH